MPDLVNEGVYIYTAVTNFAFANIRAGAQHIGNIDIDTGGEWTDAAVRLSVSATRGTSKRFNERIMWGLQ